jgi:hypothetical protein
MPYGLARPREVPFTRCVELDCTAAMRTNRSCLYDSEGLGETFLCESHWKAYCRAHSYWAALSRCANEVASQQLGLGVALRSLSRGVTRRNAVRVLKAVAAHFGLATLVELIENNHYAHPPPLVGEDSKGYPARLKSYAVWDDDEAVAARQTRSSAVASQRRENAPAARPRPTYTLVSLESDSDDSSSDSSDSDDSSSDSDDSRSESETPSQSDNDFIVNDEDPIKYLSDDGSSESDRPLKRSRDAHYKA